MIGAGRDAIATAFAELLHDLDLATLLFKFGPDDFVFVVLTKERKVAIDFFLGEHADGKTMDSLEIENVTKTFAGIADEVATGKSFHGVDSFARRRTSGDDRRHFFLVAVKDAHTGAVDQGVEHFDLGVFESFLKGSDVMAGQADMAEQPFGLHFQ